ncbi:unnamed protein product [Owenia fusiformis]|uniref:Uncharacterized protein n=1 Tax=Owenia fusiformis TaxID=6347 RepID=A0A8S4NQY2_OWEFU|nr:unnamed protein product [Owenia fusiformis]
MENGSTHGTESLEGSRLPTYTRIINKGPLPYYYLDVSYDIQNGGVTLPAGRFKTVILQALKNIFGTAGGSLQTLDLLKYDVEARRGIVRVKYSDMVKVWSSLSFYTDTIDINGTRGVFRIHQVSSHLMSFAVIGVLLGGWCLSFSDWCFIRRLVFVIQ